ncbi:GH92 family glycosyl hydrolase [uncultured Chitinophaga sp.]|uniref:GH92 family glycosyl hydrolase n=1 Tax=uncultured Chitinophaga sp. TaxID=339340 RepID=UPI0026282CCD|nr:GH92 family glycosyl hydrolase [uncultured Chitinophaga sp.]
MHISVGYYHRIIVILCFLTSVQRLAAQTRERLSYVDPFIGTGKSSVPTKWGSEGGTYPGAVAPWGYLQLTPETRVTGARGYDYSDSSIYFFSCLHHNSGFPSGSAGNLQVMPVDSRENFQAGQYKRRFSHRDELAKPGYYSVLFRDNNTRVEATATTRAGMFRFTFPAGVKPQVFINENTNAYTAFRFSEPYTSRDTVPGGYILSFAAARSGVKVILLRLSASRVSKESAERNIAVELKKGFDDIWKDTRSAWTRTLSVIDVADSSETNKTVFYTALYHACLLPWVISDADGHYRGADGKVHTVTGRNAYGGFSPWDTFRSLHPLLTLLYPDKQREMLLSMLDIYQQTGHLPIESMTGNHAVPIIVDSYLKGITGIDAALAYTAMKKSIADTPYLQQDMPAFRRQGYIPFSYPESVTRTVEYAYDDWALAQFAEKVAAQPEDQRRFLQSSYAYRQLFHPAEMSLLPRDGNTFKLQPGTTGYKEGDQWIYSYFVPHHEQDLVNLMGGRQRFTADLDEALRSGRIIFDNETVFHVPWLFNAAGAPQKTQQWIGEILQTRFAPTPGGLPGNDDLGSMSSWYIFSAMGIYPACPGRPEYSIAAPLFRAIRIHLQNGRTLEIKRTGAYPYIRSMTVNKDPYDNITISHARILEGGSIVFETAVTPAQWPSHHAPSPGEPRFTMQQYASSREKVVPHELFWIRFSLHNSGSLGTQQVMLKVNGKAFAYKNCLVDSGATIADSIPCRLYQPGKTQLSLNEGATMSVTVVKPPHPYPDKPQLSNFVLQPLVKAGSWQECTFSIRNTGGEARKFDVPLLLNDSLISTAKVLLQPGEEKQLSRRFQATSAGWYQLQLYSVQRRFRVYDDHKSTLLLDLEMEGKTADKVYDRSGFSNHGDIIRTDKPADSTAKLLLGSNCYIEVPDARSLDVMDSSITMMAWVYPTAPGDNLVDLFTKGDVHVLQVSGNRSLTFFAGGWGRGDVSAALPANWQNHWHHIAGVCNGKTLELYIDGQLKASAHLEESANLSVSNRWNIGRNEEFPSSRIFNGYMDKIKVFAAPLSAPDILEAMGAHP